MVTSPLEGENPPPWPLSKHSKTPETINMITLSPVAGLFPQLGLFPVPLEVPVSSSLDVVVVSNICAGQQQQQQHPQPPVFDHQDLF